MITKEQVMPILLNASPSFTKNWAEYSAYWEGENLLYVALGEFARHLIKLHKSNQIDEFPAVFDAVEKLHLEGDQYVKEVITVGLLEGIQNNAEYSGIKMDDFLQYLKPESAKWWKQLNGFWNGEISYVGATVKEPETIN